MPLPLGADDDVCLVGAHRLLPFCGRLGIRFILTDPFSLILFSCSLVPASGLGLLHSV